MKVYQLVLLVLVLVIVGFWLGGKLNPVIEYKAGEQVILDNLTAKINELKGAMLNDLRQCESAGYDENSGLITFDPSKTNKSTAPASIGLYQFKVATVKFYYKKFYNKDITGLEAVQIALSEEKSAELATDIIFKDGALDNWYNCSKKLGLQGRLNIIRELEK